MHFAGTASGGFSCATASFAALGLIDKSLFSIELLFTGCKDEFVPTILAVGGIIMIINGFVQSDWLLFSILMVLFVIPCIYSFILYKKGI